MADRVQVARLPAMSLISLLGKCVRRVAFAFEPIVAHDVSAAVGIVTEADDAQSTSVILHGILSCGDECKGCYFDAVSTSKIFRTIAQSPGSPVAALGVLLSLAAIACSSSVCTPATGQDRGGQIRCAEFCQRPRRAYGADIRGCRPGAAPGGGDPQGKSGRETARSRRGQRRPATVAKDLIRPYRHRMDRRLGAGDRALLRQSRAALQHRRHGAFHRPARQAATGSALCLAALSFAADDKWVTAASRRLSNPDGSFAGIVTAPLDQSYFTKLYRSIDLGQRRHHLAGAPRGQASGAGAGAKDALGNSFAEGPLLTTYLPVSETGRLRDDEHRRRRGTHRRLQGRAGAAAGGDRHLCPRRRVGAWYQNLYTFGSFVVAFVAVIMLGTFALVRRTNALAAKTRALAQDQ